MRPYFERLCQTAHGIGGESVDLRFGGRNPARRWSPPTGRPRCRALRRAASTTCRRGATAPRARPSARCRRCARTSRRGPAESLTLSHAISHHVWMNSCRRSHRGSRGCRPAHGPGPPRSRGHPRVRPARLESRADPSPAAHPPRRVPQVAPLAVPSIGIVQPAVSFNNVVIVHSPFKITRW